MSQLLVLCLCKQPGEKPITHHRDEPQGWGCQAYPPFFRQNDLPSPRLPVKHISLSRHWLPRARPEALLALLQAQPIAVCPKPKLALGRHTHINAIVPSKSFQLLGSFDASKQEFKLEKVQLAVGITYGSRELLTAASYDKDN